MNEQAKKDYENVEISVIMGVYNQFSREQLLNAVNSILSQTYGNFEFIIYDDGSDAEVSGWISDLARLDDRIVVIGSNVNNGLAFSLNRCIEYSHGRYLARMDADDEALPERFKIEHDFLESHPEIDWCGCNAVLFDDQGEWEHTTRPEFPEQNDFLRFSPYIHPTVMYRASLFKGDGEAGARYAEIREALRCEDYEIFSRLYYMGFKGCNIQQELFRYRVDIYTYHKRTFRLCIDEAKIRYRSFKRMGCLLPAGWLFCMRPIVSWFLPKGLVKWIKKMTSPL